MRKDLLAIGEIYHIFNKSIANYTIFNDDREFLRMLNTIQYYQKQKPDISFSKFLREMDSMSNSDDFISLNNKEKLVEIVCYCLMPTHFHLILKQLIDNAISIFMNNIQNSYARYFNLKHKRKGPLWESRFKNVLIKTDEQLLHLTRYIHLNPVTSFLVNNPLDYTMSSYREYLLINKNNKICRLQDILKIEPHSYRNFVEDRISYQRQLAEIKELILE